MRVVIAEDAAMMREGLIGLLQDRGHQVCAAVAHAHALIEIDLERVSWLRSSRLCLGVAMQRNRQDESESER